MKIDQDCILFEFVSPLEFDRIRESVRWLCVCALSLLDFLASLFSILGSPFHIFVGVTVLSLCLGGVVVSVRVGALLVCWVVCVGLRSFCRVRKVMSVSGQVIFCVFVCLGLLVGVVSFDVVGLRLVARYCGISFIGSSMFD